jgi:hypothetical protein
VLLESPLDKLEPYQIFSSCLMSNFFFRAHPPPPPKKKTNPTSLFL